MAASQHMHFSITLEDSEGIKASTTAQLFIDPGQTVTQVLTALTAWSLAVSKISGGKVVRNGFSVPFATLPDNTGKPVAGSEVQEAAVFDFNQTGLATHYGNVIPAYLETLETAAGQPDIAATDVAAYITLLTTAPVLGGTYSGLGNEALSSLYRAFLGDRKHRRAKFAKSVVYP